MRKGLSLLEKAVGLVATVGLSGLLVGGCPTPRSESEAQSETQTPVQTTETDSQSGGGIPDNAYIVPESGPGRFMWRDGDTYHFAQGADIEEGDILVSQRVDEMREMYGFLRRALDVQDLGNEIRVVTGAMTPQEADKNGSFIFTSGPGKEVDRSLGVNVRVIGWYYLAENLPFAEEKFFRGGLTDVNFGATLDMSFVFEARDGEVERFELSVKGDVFFSGEFYAELLESGEMYVLDGEVFNQKQIFYGQFGWVPVVLVVEEDSKFSAGAKVDGAIKSKASLDALFSIRAGGEYKRGEGWSPITECSLSANPDMNEFCVSGVSGASVLLETTVSTSFYGVMDGPSIGLSPYEKVKLYGANCFGDEGTKRYGYWWEIETGATAPFRTGTGILNFWSNDDLFGGSAKYVVGGHSPGVDRDWPGDPESYGVSHSSHDVVALAENGGSSVGSSGSGSLGGGSGGCFFGSVEPDNRIEEAGRVSLCSSTIIEGILGDKDDIDNFVLYADGGTRLDISATPSNSIMTVRNTDGFVSTPSGPIYVENSGDVRINVSNYHLGKPYEREIRYRISIGRN